MERLESCPHTCVLPNLDRELFQSMPNFFPLSANISSYSHYVFATLDHEDTGVITFEVRIFSQGLPTTIVDVVASRLGDRVYASLASADRVNNASNKKSLSHPRISFLVCPFSCEELWKTNSSGRFPSTTKTRMDSSQGD